LQVYYKHKISLCFSHVIDGYLRHLALRVGHDRFFYLDWGSKFLVDRAIAGDKVEESIKNMDNAMEKSRTIGRVLDEYTVRDKVQYVLQSMVVYCE
jgi:hypothetical protein